MIGCSLRRSAGAENTTCGLAIFSAEFAGFVGHFPEAAGGAILPGFVQVQVALDLLKLAGEASRLLRVEDGRFLRAIRPGEEIRVTLVAESAGRFRVTLNVGEEMCSRFRLMVGGEQELAGAQR